jgi:hypothetical protein
MFISEMLYKAFSAHFEEVSRESARQTIDYNRSIFLMFSLYWKVVLLLLTSLTYGFRIGNRSFVRTVRKTFPPVGLSDVHYLLACGRKCTRMLLSSKLTNNFHGGKYSPLLAVENSEISPSVDRQFEANNGYHKEELGFQSPTYQSGFVSIVGNPNAGKSTLLNSLLGQPLCIVNSKPQTTRHRILGVLTVPPTQPEISTHSSESQANPTGHDGYQLVFSDTPGLLAPAYKLQQLMQDTVRTVLFGCCEPTRWYVYLCIVLHFCCCTVRHKNEK